MRIELNWPEIVVGLIIAFQLYASVRVLWYGGYTPVQKIMQLLIVWLIPFFGALAVHFFLAADTAPRRRADTQFTPDGGGNPPGINGPPT